MTNRTILGRLPTGEMGLRVSRPGSNVLDMGLPPNQVAFDSRWFNSARHHLEDEITVPPLGTGTSYTTVSYGIDFGVIPPVQIFYRNANSGVWVEPGARLDGGEWETFWEGFYEPVRLYSSYMQLLHPYAWAGAVSVVYRYVILRPL